MKAMNLTQQEKDRENLYYADPLLKFSHTERLLLQVLRSVALIFSFIASFVFLLSDIGFLKIIGVLLVAYVLFESGKALYFASNARKFKGGNLLSYVTPKTRGMLISAYNNSSILGGGIYLYLLKALAERSFIQTIIKEMGILPGEFLSRVDKFLSEEKSLKETSHWKRAKVNQLVKEAFILQQPDKHPIREEDLFRALVYADNERLQRIFGLFEITPQGVEAALKPYNISR